MAATLACIAGEELHRQWQAGRIVGERKGPRQTPFGPSGEVYLVEPEGAEEPCYLLARHEPGLGKPAPRKINNRANIYALKDLGAKAVLAFGPGAAVTHNIAVGDLVILSDLIDLTFLRTATFFEDSPLGYVRQFPVFCPALRRTAEHVLHGMKLAYHNTGVAAVCEGPRLETPAEVLMLAAMGAGIVTHSFAPEAFLARELQICYAPICYVVNYAETGRRHRPFAAGGLFTGLSHVSDDDRLAGAVAAMRRIVGAAAAALASEDENCQCAQAMAQQVHRHDLPADWRKWFD